MLITLKNANTGNYDEYDYTGDRPCTEAEFTTFSNYVKSHQSRQAELYTKQEKLRELAEKALNIPVETSGLTPEEIEELSDLAEIEASRIGDQIDQVGKSIDQIWRLVPEVVTGGSYELHVKRWGADI